MENAAAPMRSLAWHTLRRGRFALAYTGKRGGPLPPQSRSHHLSEATSRRIRRQQISRLRFAGMKWHRHPLRQCGDRVVNAQTVLTDFLSKACISQRQAAADIPGSRITQIEQPLFG